MELLTLVEVKRKCLELLLKDEIVNDPCPDYNTERQQGIWEVVEYLAKEIEIAEQELELLFKDRDNGQSEEEGILPSGDQRYIKPTIKQ